MEVREHTHNNWLDSQPCEHCEVRKQLCKVENCPVQRLVDKDNNVLSMYDRRKKLVVQGD